MSQTSEITLLHFSKYTLVLLSNKNFVSMVLFEERIILEMNEKAQQKFSLIFYMMIHQCISFQFCAVTFLTTNRKFTIWIWRAKPWCEEWIVQEWRVAPRTYRSLRRTSNSTKIRHSTSLANSSYNY